MAGLVRKVVRALVAQPWDYMGAGAPQEPEFRVSPDGRHYAAYDPERGTWLYHEMTTGLVVAEEASLGEVDRYCGDWRRFLEELDDDDH